MRVRWQGNILRRFRYGGIMNSQIAWAKTQSTFEVQAGCSRRAVIVIASFLALATAGAGANSSAPHRLRHYVFVNRDRQRIADPAFLQTKAFEGAQLKYTWRELERGKDQYDFSDIRHDLAFLNSKGKRLFIQIQDASFDVSIVPIPRYLLTDPQYHGGADKQYNIVRDDEVHATPAGWVARRCDPAVRERFQKLLLTLGKEFDGKVEGINLPETAVDFGQSGMLFPKGFTPEIYRDAVIDTMQVLKRAFPHSVAMQYANFMPGSDQTSAACLRDVYQRAKALNVALGGPDCMPYKPGQMANSYPLLREFAGTVPTGIAVQDGNYEHINPKTGQRVTIPGIANFAADYLKVDYVFWCTEEPFYSKELIPYLRAVE
jgi:hypothetical protein